MWIIYDDEVELLMKVPLKYKGFPPGSYPKSAVRSD